MNQNIQLDSAKSVKKWSKILESIGINATPRNAEKIEWMSEYAEYHNINAKKGLVQENTGYSNLGNLTGMGAVVSPGVNVTPGQTGAYTSLGQATGAGSGDFGQQLLPIAMKIAGQTIGLDLVGVKPSPGPVIDLMYVDFKYDDGPTNDQNYVPVVFKIATTAADTNSVNLNAMIAELNAILTANLILQTSGGLSSRVWVTLPANPTGNQGGNRAGGALSSVLSEPATKTGVLEFLGFSRIDGLPMFRAYRTTNASSMGQFYFDITANTFGTTETVKNAFETGSFASTSGSADGLIGGFATNTVLIELISALEDHIPGFVSNWNKDYGMPREQDDTTYPGIIAPSVSVKRITVGSIEVTSALKRTEIEDIKAQTGMDIVQKLESVLVNELSQTISKQIVTKVYAMGNLNRSTLPTNTSGYTMFDFDVDSYFGGGTAPAGETTQSAQRKLITKIDAASNYIATEGRVGPATFAVTNGKLAAALKTAAGFIINPIESKLNAPGQLYPLGTIGGLTIYVDPYQKYTNDVILLGRKNNPDQPGIIFIPYLMAQSVNLISEATFGPRMMLRSRYAIGELGWYPQKQYMTVKVNDTKGYLV
jgi:hypothetical protein